jgi:hypothetical protein
MLSFGVPSAVIAKPNGHGQSAKHDKEKNDKNDRRVVVTRRAVGRTYFTPSQVQVIHDYYGPRYRDLPPGLQKKLYRTGQLPPGWQKRFQPFPVTMERRLAPVPRYYRRGVIDNYAVVYDSRRNVIIDVAPLWR